MRFFLLSIFTAFLLAGCTIAENQTTLKKTGLPAEFFNTEWRLVQDADPAQDQSGEDAPMLLFGWEENRIFGSGGCNRFSGAYKAGEDNSLSFENVISTQIGCPDSVSESQFHKRLTHISYYSFNKDFTLLNMHDADGEILLSFRKLTYKRI